MLRRRHKKEAKNLEKKLITKIDTDKDSHTSTSAILQTFKGFYTELFTSESIDESLTDFLSDVPKLDENDFNICEEKITRDEILVALNSMENNKSPGSDGINKVFYITFLS